MEERNIPIDINAGKLLDWLISRRHCNRDWQSNIMCIREKINNAIQDMPVHEGIAKLLSGTHIHYFHCKKIIEILKETEADSKNLFGRYGSQRMKDWMEIIKLYEKDNIYLAEAAQMLIRNINYEIPGIKKQIQKLDQTQNELTKKEEEYIKSENLARVEFNNICKQLGIAGDSIKKELAERLIELPEIYMKIAKKTKSLENIVTFYTEFVKFSLGHEYSGGCVPMVKYIIEKGNTTIYEWTYGEEPLSIVEPPLYFTTDEDEKKISDNIDFGDNEIDFGSLDANDTINYDLGDNVDVGGDIDWGAETVSDIVEDKINFDICLEEAGIVVELSGNDGGIATGNHAYTILDNPKTRSDFIDQLFELEAFLKIRLYELKSNSNYNLLTMSSMQEAAPIVQMATAESIQNILDNVQIIISEIMNKRVQHLHNIKHSPRYVDTLTAMLKQKLSLVEKMKSLQKLVREKKEDSRTQTTKLQPMLKLIIAKTKELQVEIEQDISKKYKNRTVHLTGGINIL